MEAIQGQSRTYTVGEARNLACAHCDGGFDLDNPNADDDAHAYITGGLIEAIGCDNEDLVYHGYLYQEDNCFFKATKGELFYKIDSDYRDLLSDQISKVVGDWFSRYGPQGCKLTKIGYKLDMTYAIPDTKVQQYDNRLIGNKEEEESNDS